MASGAYHVSDEASSAVRGELKAMLKHCRKHLQ